MCQLFHTNSKGSCWTVSSRGRSGHRLKMFSDSFKTSQLYNSLFFILLFPLTGCRKDHLSPSTFYKEKTYVFFLFLRTSPVSGSPWNPIVSVLELVTRTLNDRTIEDPTTTIFKDHLWSDSLYSFFLINNSKSKIIFGPITYGSQIYV